MSVERATELQEQAWALQADGKLSDALAACSEAVNLVKQSEGPDSPDLANLLNDLAEIQIEQQDYRAALASASLHEIFSRGCRIHGPAKHLQPSVSRLS